MKIHYIKLGETDPVPNDRQRVLLWYPKYNEWVSTTFYKDADGDLYFKPDTGGACYIFPTDVEFPGIGYVMKNREIIWAEMPPAPEMIRNK